MEWSHYTFAEAIYRTTRLVLRKEQLNAAEKADHLHHLLCLMVKRLPQDWGTETRKVLEIKDCKAEALLHSLDIDLQRTGFQPEQYAVFGALRQLILTIRELREAVQTDSHPVIIPSTGYREGGYASSATHS